MAQPDVGPRRVEECKEYDEKRRECQVWFYARPVNASLNTKNLDGSPAVHLLHWAITVYFPDGDRYLTFEGFEEDGKLVATRTNGAPTVFSMQQYLGTCSTSPADWLKIAQRNTYNGTGYHVTLRNCQTWAKEFVKSFGQGIRSKVDNFNTFVETVGVPAAVFVSSLSNAYEFAYAATSAISRSSEAIRGFSKSPSRFQKSI